MKEQVAAACIHCDYEGTYKRVDATPHWHLWLAAKNSPNPFYLRDLERRTAAEQDDGVDITNGSMMDPTADCMDLDLEPTENVVYSPLSDDRMSGRMRRSMDLMKAEHLSRVSSRGMCGRNRSCYARSRIYVRVLLRDLWAG